VARIEMLLHFAKTGAFPPTENWRAAFRRVPGPLKCQVSRKDRKVEFPLRIQAHSYAKSVYKHGGAPITGKTASPNVNRPSL
jgi:hypothetical protein